MLKESKSKKTPVKKKTAAPSANGSKGNGVLNVDIEALEGLMSAINGSTVGEITVAKGDAFVTIKRGASARDAGLPSLTRDNANSAPVQQSKDETHKDAKSLEGSIDIFSPAVGIFLRAKDARSDPFVKLRDNIAAGDVVAMIRYMGINHDIKSEVSGKLVEILVEDGQAIVYGQPLFRLK